MLLLQIASADDLRGVDESGPAVIAQSSPAASVQENDPLERAQRDEIIGAPGRDPEREIQKFFELVILPFGVCLLLVMVLRRGIFS